MADPARATTWAAPIAALLLLAGCSAPHAPPVVERSPAAAATPIPGHYTVRRGDTLYAIAWRHGLDYRDLAHHNGIEPPYRIFPNQQLALRGVPRPVRSGRPVSVPAPAPSDARGRTETARAPVQAPRDNGPRGAPDGSGHAWRWPAQGRLVRDYGGASRAIDLELTPGSQVTAVAAGEVVYAGAGLRGFRHLVIIKHDSTYLSAYSLNDDIAVSEGQQVAAGARLASIAATGASPLLRFEIRRDGAPIDPRGLLDRS